MRQIPLIKVYPDANPQRVSQIYAGLSDLNLKGKAQILWLKRRPAELKDVSTFNPNVLFIEIEDPIIKDNYIICFDVADQFIINAHERLRICDIYIKRSYYQPYINTLEKDLGKKIIPYGLHYSCRLKKEKGKILRCLIYLKSLNKFSKKSLSKECIKTFISRSYLAEDYEVMPYLNVENKILFQSRLWADKFKNRQKISGMTFETVHEIDETRIQTVKALKKAFGKRFLGGLIPTGYAINKYPDCVSNLKTSKRGFLALVRECMIAVTTSGLHGSTGWKLPEYIAASRCIVTEQILYELPVELEKNRNILIFKTPEQCVQACDKLLSDRVLSERMRVKNYQYYKDNVHPGALIENCLIAARERYALNNS